MHSSGGDYVGELFVDSVKSYSLKKLEECKNNRLLQRRSAKKDKPE